MSKQYVLFIDGINPLLDGRKWARTKSLEEATLWFQYACETRPNSQITIDADELDDDGCVLKDDDGYIISTTILSNHK